jgi:hypothetical protein
MSRRAVLVIPLLAALACSSSNTETHSATMTPANVVPSTTSNGSGTFNATVNGSGDTATVAWTLNANNMTSTPNAAHIHSGPPGTNGPILVPLPISVGSNGVSATGSGTIDATQIQGGTTMSALLDAMRSNGLYVDVHTVSNPNGEIRGPIQ